MTTGLIDVHGHYLPAVDDGCQTVAESIACARQLVAAGYTHAFCTPHIWPSLPKNTRDAVVAGVAQLQNEFDRASVPLQLAPGAEYNIAAMWPRLRDRPRDQLITYGMNGKYLLCDFWAGAMDDCRDVVHAAIRHLRSLEIVPILAHPERIEALQDQPDEIERMIDLGCKLQLNSWCLAEQPDSPIYQLATRLLGEGKYFLIGTDCHDPETLDIRIRGVTIAREMVGEKIVDQLTIINPRQLLGQ